MKLRMVLCWVGIHDLKLVRTFLSFHKFKCECCGKQYIDMGFKGLIPWNAGFEKNERMYDEGPGVGCIDDEEA